MNQRQAIEPTISHPKADHRMDRCRLQGATGEALHAVLCATRFNMRWLPRAIVRHGISAVISRLWRWWNGRGVSAMGAMSRWLAPMRSECRRDVDLPHSRAGYAAIAAIDG